MEFEAHTTKQARIWQLMPIEERKLLYDQMAISVRYRAITS